MRFAFVLCNPLRAIFIATFVAVGLAAAADAQIDCIAFRGVPVNPDDSIRDVVAADFDGDGRTDLVVHRGGSAVRIFRNDGLDRWIHVEDLHLAQPFRNLSAIDLENDGDVDVIAAMEPNRLGILRNDGAGGFVEEGIPGLPHAVAGLATGDVNGDGDPDLFVASPDANGVSWLASDGNGGYALPASIPCPHMTTALALADMNEDSILDLVYFGTFDDDFWGYLEGLGAGAFEITGPEYEVDGIIESSAVTDFDNDGRPDILLGRRSDTALLFRGQAGGGIDPSPIDLGQGEIVRAADLDDDGNPDLVMAYSKSFRHRLGDGAFGFGPTEIVATTHVVTGLLIAELTNDPQVDALLVMKEEQADTFVTIAPGTGQGGWRQGALLDTLNMRAIETIDANGDLFPDLLALTTSNLAYIAVGVGDGTVELTSGLTVPGGSTHPVVCDFDEDGREDIAIAKPGFDQITVIRTTPSGALDPNGITTTNLVGAPRVLAVADFDNDGHLDIVAGCNVSNTLEFLFGDGTGSFPQVVSIHGFLTTEEIVVGNFDDVVDPSGTIDLIVHDAERVGFFFVRNNGNRTFEVPSAFPAEMTSATAVADLNDDGHLDLVLATPDGVRTRFGTGLGVFSESTVPHPDLPEDAESIHTLDADEDGRVDVMVVAEGRIAFGFGSGNGFFPAVVLLESPDATRDSALLDLNDDGLLDIVVASGAGIRKHANRSDRTIRCRASRVNAENAGPRTNVLRVNGSFGENSIGETVVDAMVPLEVTIDRAPTTAADSRYYATIHEGAPSQATTVSLPLSIGFSCFQPLVMEPGFVAPLHVANTIKPNDPRLLPPGSSATGDSLPGAVLDIPGSTFQPGAILTVQGLLGDGNSPSRKRVSTTNAVIVHVQ